MELLRRHLKNQLHLLLPLAILLAALIGWASEPSVLDQLRLFVFDEFMDGISFISKVAKVAERHEHHPDIKVRYTTITLSVQTHSEGGVTSWDIGLARAIDRIKS